ncbi:hypothetical protein HMPREF1292_01576 [Corynebacterium sp. KPL1995]|nr:hypothetical protein HMPREF1292_01576 [Corynebacterium sp. KPL1995]ERS71742.1 hypothetical protein HMPREF1290_01582 [Corynebacterium sp. KPL1989]
MTDHLRLAADKSEMNTVATQMVAGFPSHDYYCGHGYY